MFLNVTFGFLTWSVLWSSSVYLFLFLNRRTTLVGGLLQGCFVVTCTHARSSAWVASYEETGCHGGARYVGTPLRPCNAAGHHQNEGKPLCPQIHLIWVGHENYYPPPGSTQTLDSCVPHCEAGQWQGLGEVWERWKNQNHVAVTC